MKGRASCPPRTAAAPQPRGRGGLWDLGRWPWGSGQSSLWVGPVHQQCVSPDPTPPPALPPAPRGHRPVSQQMGRICASQCGLRAQHPFVFSQWGNSWGASHSGEPQLPCPEPPKATTPSCTTFQPAPGQTGEAASASALQPPGTLGPSPRPRLLWAFTPLAPGGHVCRLQTPLSWGSSTARFSAGWHPTLELTRKREMMLQGLRSPLVRGDGGPQPPTVTAPASLPGPGYPGRHPDTRRLLHSLPASADSSPQPAWDDLCSRVPPSPGPLSPHALPSPHPRSLPLPFFASTLLCQVLGTQRWVPFPLPLQILEAARKTSADPTLWLKGPRRGPL